MLYLHCTVPWAQTDGTLKHMNVIYIIGMDMNRVFLIVVI